MKISWAWYWNMSSYVEVLNYFEKSQSVKLDGYIFPSFFFFFLIAKNYLHVCKKLPQPISLSCLSRCFLYFREEERDYIQVEGFPSPECIIRSKGKGYRDALCEPSNYPHSTILQQDKGIWIYSRILVEI